MAPKLIQELDLKTELSFILAEIDRKFPILSGNIRGSYHYHLNHQEPLSNELDVYLVFDTQRLTREIYTSTVSRFENLCDRLANSDKEGYVYKVETKMGPLKPETPQTFQFHLLIDDKDECEKTLNIVKLMWRKESTLLVGTHLEELEIFKPESIKRRRLVGNCHGSISGYIENIKKDEIHYGEWGSNPFMKERKMKTGNTNFARLIFMEYCCLTSLKNTIRFFTQPEDFYPSRHNILVASSSYFNENIDFIGQLIRREAFSQEVNVERAANKAVKFLEYLIAKVP